MKLTKLLAAAFLVPLQSGDWLDLKYEDIKANQVKFHNNKISIAVDSSASPLFYKFKKPVRIKSFTLSGNIQIDKKIKESKDDRYIQLGLIYQGDYTPNLISQFFLPEWIEKLLKTYDQKGLGNITFWGPGEKKKREIEIRDLKLTFYNKGKIEKDHFLVNASPKNNKKVIGLWLRADGDDSSAQFKVEVRKIKVQED